MGFFLFLLTWDFHVGFLLVSFWFSATANAKTRRCCFFLPPWVFCCDRWKDGFSRISHFHRDIVRLCSKSKFQAVALSRIDQPVVSFSTRCMRKEFGTETRWAKNARSRTFFYFSAFTQWIRFWRKNKKFWPPLLLTDLNLRQTYKIVGVSRSGEMKNSSFYWFLR